MPVNYKCNLQSKFEAAKMFLADFNIDNKTSDSKPNAKSMHKEFGPKLGQLGKSFDAIMKKVEECRADKNVIHCEFCERNINCKTR